MLHCFCLTACVAYRRAPARLTNIAYTPHVRHKFNLNQLYVLLLTCTPHFFPLTNWHAHCPRRTRRLPTCRPQIQIQSQTPNPTLLVLLLFFSPCLVNVVVVVAVSRFTVKFMGAQLFQVPRTKYNLVTNAYFTLQFSTTYCKCDFRLRRCCCCRRLCCCCFIYFAARRCENLICAPRQKLPF